MHSQWWGNEFIIRIRLFEWDGFSLLVYLNETVRNNDELRGFRHDLNIREMSGCHSLVEFESQRLNRTPQPPPTSKHVGENNRKDSQQSGRGTHPCPSWVCLLPITRDLLVIQYTLAITATRFACVCLHELLLATMLLAPHPPSPTHSPLSTQPGPQRIHSRPLTASTN